MSINYLEAIQEEIKKTISRSSVPEDYSHALNTRHWVLRLKPNADWGLQIAALAHDIERAFPHRKVKRQDFYDYDEYKRAHAANSAQIMAKILTRCPLDSKIKDRILELIRHHELGAVNDPDLAVLKDADGLSFFEVNLPLYAQRNSDSEVLFRMKWGYQRLSPRAKKIIKKFRYLNERLNKFLDEVILSENAVSKQDSD